jgi:hypothetical protein
VDGTMHDGIDYIRELRSDGLRHYSDVINAVQEGYQNRMTLNDIHDRLAELERFVADLRSPPAA